MRILSPSRKPSLAWFLVVLTVLIITNAQEDTEASETTEDSVNEAGSLAHSAVVDLTPDNFDASLKDPANPIWLLKFYAPWCGHCKRLAPILDEVAPQLAGKLAIGKIDCTQHKKLCNEFGVKGYPTMKYSIDSQIQAYPGGRTAQEILQFADKLRAPPVTLVHNYEQAEQAAREAQDGVAFVVHHPNLILEEDALDAALQSTELTQIFAQVARQNQAHAEFLMLAPGADTSAFARPSDEAGFINRLEPNVPPKALDVVSPTSEQVSHFVYEHNVATVSMLGPSNFQKVASKGRPLVIGAFDETLEDTTIREGLLQQLNAYATDGPADLLNRYYFGLMEGSKWKKFLKQFDVRELPQVFVLDVPTKTYWQDEQALYRDTETNKHDIAGFLKAIQNGDILQKKGSKPSDLFEKLEAFFIGNMPWSLIAIALIVGLFLISLLPFGSDDSDEAILNEGSGAGSSGTPVPPPEAFAEKSETKKDK